MNVCQVVFTKLQCEVLLKIFFHHGLGVFHVWVCVCVWERERERVQWTFTTRIYVYLDLCMIFGQFYPPIWRTLDCKTTKYDDGWTWNTKYKVVLVVLLHLLLSSGDFVPTSAHPLFVQIYLNISSTYTFLMPQITSANSRNEHTQSSSMSMHVNFWERIGNGQ